MADETNNGAPLVDEASISPVKNKDRRNSLEAYLKHRPDRHELVEKNILPESTASPAIQAQQKELKKSMLMDNLKEKIGHRPDPEELMKTGVLHEDPRSPDEKYAEAIEEEYAKREGGA